MMHQRDERGSVTVWGALIALVLITVIGITVDLTGQVNAQQRAHDLAQQAGRTAANQVQAAQIMRASPRRSTPLPPGPRPVPIWPQRASRAPCASPAPPACR